MQSGESSGQTQVYPSGLVGLSRQSVELLQLVLLQGFSTVERERQTPFNVLAMYLCTLYNYYVLIVVYFMVQIYYVCVKRMYKKSLLDAWLIVSIGSLYLFGLLKISVFDAQLNN